MRKIKLAIAEDNEKFRDVISGLLQLENDFEVIIEASNGLHLLEELKTKTPDIILMDIRMPLMNGIEATNKIKESYPHLKIIAFSQYELEEEVVEMNIRGVNSFIGKGDSPETLFKAIRIIHDGGVFMTAKTAEIVQNYLRRHHQRSAQSSSYLHELSDLEKKLLNGICQGLSSTELAEQICKSPRTVEKYRMDLYRKFNVINKEQLISQVAKLPFMNGGIRIIDYEPIKK